jgi:predicted RNA-binding protein YlxR (DUF448 family)
LFDGGNTAMTTGKQRTKRKHIPRRTCVICRETRPKRALTRLVRTQDEGVQIDPTGKRAGRGAYLCDNPECWQKAASGNVLGGALRTDLTDQDRKRIIEHGTQLKNNAKIGHDK